MRFKKVLTLSQGRGFTFVEVLATMMFASIVLPAAMRGISLAVSAAAESKRVSEATFLAQNLIAGILNDTALDYSFPSSDFMPEDSRYNWTAEFFEWQDESLKELVVQVFWDARNSKRSISVSTLVYMGGS